jgi:predicted acylesterase/phospholipase RssA
VGDHLVTVRTKSAEAAVVDLSNKKKIAFVCSGGAVKAAAYHVGVAMALEHLGYSFAGGLAGSAEDTQPADPSKTISTYVGSSAGSLITAFLSQGRRLSELQSAFMSDPKSEGIPGMKYWEMLSPRMRKATDIFGFNTAILKMIRNPTTFQSPFGTAGIQRYLLSNVIKTDHFSDLKAELFIVTTETNHIRKVIFGKTVPVTNDERVEYRNDVSISDACAASMSLPPIYHPYTIQIDGKKREFFDGEIYEPLSTHVARDAGCDLVICSYTHQPLELSKYRDMSFADKGVQHITLQAIYQAIEQKIRYAREGRKREKMLVDDLRKFFVEKKIDMKLFEELMKTIQERLLYRPNTDYIYIHPKASDYETFMAPHFSLNRSATEHIVRKGYFSARIKFKRLALDP